MTRFYASARGILERDGGTVEKFIGDAAAEVLRRSTWSASGRVEELESTGESLRAFPAPPG